MISQKAVQKAYAELLANFEWQVFCTLTFANPPHPEAAAKTFRHFVNIINIRIYGKRWRSHGQGIFWVRALEYHKSGVIHFHALLGDIGDLNTKILRSEIKAIWEELAGWCRISPIDDKLEAVTNYISKYVVKGGEIDFCDKLENFRVLDSRLILV